jgi:hypothetical protein
MLFKFKMNGQEQKKKLSRLAILSLVFAILTLIFSVSSRMIIEDDISSYGIYINFIGWSFLTSGILTLLFGISSLVMIKRSEGKLRGKALAISAIIIVALSTFVPVLFPIKIYIDAT